MRCQGHFGAARGADDLVFVSGQLGTDPATGTLATGGIAAETKQVCDNIKTILEAAGGSIRWLNGEPPSVEEREAEKRARRAETPQAKKRAKAEATAAQSSKKRDDKAEASDDGAPKSKAQPAKTAEKQDPTSATSGAQEKVDDGAGS